MRLLYATGNIKVQGGYKLELAEFHGENIPPYAILSHTWGTDDEEVSFRELTERPHGFKKKEGYKKLRFCMRMAAAMGLEYAWG